MVVLPVTDLGGRYEPALFIVLGEPSAHVLSASFRGIYNVHNSYMA